MKTWLRRIAYGSAALLLAALVVGLFNWERLERLYRVNTLFEPDRIVANFSNMDAMFLTAPIRRGGPVRAFEAAPAPLPAAFVASQGEIGTNAFLEETQTTSLLVIRDGAVEFEGYYKDTGPEDLRISWSVAKSFLSALVGVALEDGAIESLDDPVVRYAPSLVGSAYEGATLRQVAAMSSGVRFNEDYLDYDSDINRMGRELALGGSLDDFAGRLIDAVGPAGEVWRYVSIDTHVLGMALRGATGATVAEYMSDKLWSRLGAEADGLYLTDGHGAAFVLGGLNLRTRDYARFGQLVLDDGAWNGVQVLPADWLRESTADTAPPPPESGRRGQGYGYQWWTPPSPDEEVYGIGVYGQYLYIDRKARVVIVKTSADRDFRAEESRAQHDSIAFFRAVARPQSR